MLWDTPRHLDAPLDALAPARGLGCALVSRVQRRARPDLTFLADIPEACGYGVQNDWRAAIAAAGKATHQPSDGVVPEPAQAPDAVAILGPPASVVCAPVELPGDTPPT